MVLLRASTEGISSSLVGLVWFCCDSLEQQYQGFHLVSMVSSSSSPFVSRPNHACLMVVLVRFDELRMKAKVPRFSAWMWGWFSEWLFPSCLGKAFDASYW